MINLVLIHILRLFVIKKKKKNRGEYLVNDIINTRWHCRRTGKLHRTGQKVKER